MARLKPEHLAELRQLRGVGLAIIEAVGQAEDLGEMGPRMRQVLDGAWEAQNLRGMREVVRDLRDMLPALSETTRKAVFQEIEKTLGSALRTLDDTDQGVIAAVLHRGLIRNDREYYMVRSHLERLESDPARVAEVGSVVRLLETYRVS
jgi:hypothetical protein